MSDQDPNTLKQQLAEFYGGIEVPPSILNDVPQQRTEPTERKDWRTWSNLGAAAAALIALAGVIVLAMSGSPREDVAALAMAEVAHNHRKGIAPEVLTGDYSEVQGHLARLDFSVEPPSDGLAGGYQLLGGRYCKVRGEFAAQLKVRPRDGGPTATLYIVPAAGRLAEITATAALVDGVRVRCERAGTRLVFLAEDEKP